MRGTPADHRPIIRNRDGQELLFRSAKRVTLVSYSTVPPGETASCLSSATALEDIQFGRHQEFALPHTHSAQGSVTFIGGMATNVPGPRVVGWQGLMEEGSLRCA
jgi:hypothetical protein